MLGDTLAEALTQNFATDYDALLSKIGTALAEKRIGDFLLRAHIDDVRTGSSRRRGTGLFTGGGEGECGDRAVGVGG